MRISDWSSDVCSSDLKPTPSPVVAEIIDDFRNRAGLKRRDISDDEIVARTLYTMVNEGAKILEEDIAQRASDIDVVWLYGYGWPRHKGGPMFWADQIGLATVVQGLERYAARIGEDFSIASLLSRRVVDGGSLEKCNHTLPAHILPPQPTNQSNSKGIPIRDTVHHNRR